jgi:DNA-3-methyladenine glycosylase I
MPAVYWKKVVLMTLIRNSENSERSRTPMNTCVYARIVKQIQKEFGSFDAYLWKFTNGKVIDGHFKTPEEMPTESEVSRAMSADMRKRGIAYVGPVITYSFLQSIGIVNDHLADCERR